MISNIINKNIKQDLDCDWDYSPSVNIIKRELKINIKEKFIKQDVCWIKILKESSAELQDSIKIKIKNDFYLFEFNYNQNNFRLNETINSIIEVLNKYKENKEELKFKVLSV